MQVGVWIDAGSRHENEKHNGVAHFLEHMIYKVCYNLYDLTRLTPEKMLDIVFEFKKKDCNL